MITNERQYKISRANAQRFKDALSEFNELAAIEKGIDPIIVKAQRESLKSQYEDILNQLEEYENLKSGNLRRFVGDSLLDVGEILVRARIANGHSQKELATRLGLKEQQIQRYEAERYCTANLERLAKVFAALGLFGSFIFEANKQNALDQIAPNLKSANINLKKLPLKEMKRRGWFNDLQLPPLDVELSDEMLAAAFLSQSIGNPSRALFRQKVRARGTVDMHALFAWQARVLQKGRRLKRQFSVGEPRFDTQWIPEVVQLSNDDNGPVKAVRLLREKGVIVVIEPHLDRTYLDGAAMLLDDETPLVALTLRHDRLDNFWFVLFHELGHIFQHRKSGLECGFFDEEVGDDDTLESEADAFAQNALISEEAWNASFVRYVNSAQEIQAFAKKYKVGIAVVAGRIRRERNNFSVFTELVGLGRVRKLFAAEEV